MCNIHPWFQRQQDARQSLLSAELELQMKVPCWLQRPRAELERLLEQQHANQRAVCWVCINDQTLVDHNNAVRRDGHISLYEEVIAESGGPFEEWK